MDNKTFIVLQEKPWGSTLEITHTFCVSAAGYPAVEVTAMSKLLHSPALSLRLAIIAYIPVPPVTDL